MTNCANMSAAAAFEKEIDHIDIVSNSKQDALKDFYNNFHNDTVWLSFQERMKVIKQYLKDRIKELNTENIER